MNDRLTTEIERIRSNPSIPSLDEAAVKQGVIMRILNALGWDTFDIEEVKPEHSVGSRKVDYALRINGRNKVFLEAKRPNEDLGNPAPQLQLLDYSFREGVPLAVLTNGLHWWFYLPLREGSWEERRFYNNDIAKDDITDTVNRLTDFLSRDNVSSGEAIKNAESHLTLLRSEREIDETLPKAWAQLISDPDKMLVELLDDKVEELCGRWAGPERTKRFLTGWTKTIQVRSIPTASLIPSTSPVSRRDAEHPRKRKKTSPVTFTFRDKKVQVKAWWEVLTKLAEVIYENHRHEFSDKVRGLSGWYSSEYTSLRIAPKPVGNSGWYVYTNISGNNTKSKCYELVAKFGYPPDALQIETT